ncbi:MAG TPA: hypothetical protein VG713_19665 [Pirellulales bacterium]|nr:hypothetical protein [Pirellulales bacterium]
MRFRFNSLTITVCALGLIAAVARICEAAPPRTSELMPVDFMAALEGDSRPLALIPSALPDPSGAPASEVAQPEVIVPPAIVADEPLVSGPVFALPAWMEYHTCPKCQPWTRGYLGSNYGTICYCNDRQINGFVFDGLVRGFYLNDQRIEWSGMESTFGAEAILIPRIVYNTANWTIAGNSVFFINEPFDRNMYVTPERASYLANFQVQPVEIWNLNIALSRDDFRFSFGKDNTPFGRYYFPLFSNSRMDAPFIRTDVISWVETGAFIRWTPGIFSIDAAVVNGGSDKDTNSSKGGIGRIGIQSEDQSFVAGISGKVSDGIGSEVQKELANYYGGDFMIRRGCFDLSGEAIYNQYGFRKPYNPNNIFWGRNLYYRDMFGGTVDAGMHGWGYYVNAGFTLPHLRTDINYGEFYPSPIGNPLTDTPIRRGIVKGTWTFIPRVEQYLALIFENNRPVEAWRSTQKGFAILTGLQTYF